MGAGANLLKGLLIDRECLYVGVAYMRGVEAKGTRQCRGVRTPVGSTRTPVGNLSKTSQPPQFLLAKWLVMRRLTRGWEAGSSPSQVNQLTQLGGGGWGAVQGVKSAA